MGNLCAECQRCTIVIDQCEACELLPRRNRGLNTRNGASGSPGREGDTDDAWTDAADVSGWMARPMAQRGRGAAQQRSGQDADGAFGNVRLQRLIDDGSDATLQAAIAASHASMSSGFGSVPAQRQSSEEELLAQAIAASKLEEETRERAQLREEQSREYEESLRVDRERALKQKEEDRKQKAMEEARAKEEQEAERIRREEADALAKAEEEEKARVARVAVLVEEACSKLSEEPPVEEPGRVTVRIRTPEGKALKRSFRNTDPVDQLYLYATAEGGDLASQDFRLIATMPRSVYEDREATLQDVGLQGQCALLVEIIETDEPEGD